MNQEESSPEHYHTGAMTLDWARVSHCKDVSVIFAVSSTPKILHLLWYSNYFDLIFRVLKCIFHLYFWVTKISALEIYHIFPNIFYDESKSLLTGVKWYIQIFSYSLDKSNILNSEVFFLIPTSLLIH